MCACAFCALGPAFVNAHYKQILLSAAVFDAKKQILSLEVITIINTTNLHPSKQMSWVETRVQKHLSYRALLHIVKSRGNKKIGDNNVAPTQSER